MFPPIVCEGSDETVTPAKLTPKGATVSQVTTFLEHSAALTDESFDGPLPVQYTLQQMRKFVWLALVSKGKPARASSVPDILLGADIETSLRIATFLRHEQGFRDIAAKAWDMGDAVALRMLQELPDGQVLARAVMHVCGGRPFALQAWTHALCG